MIAAVSTPYTVTWMVLGLAVIGGVLAVIIR
jgi:hypothetical protein